MGALDNFKPTEPGKGKRGRHREGTQQAPQPAGYSWTLTHMAPALELPVGRAPGTPHSPVQPAIRAGVRGRVPLSLSSLSSDPHEPEPWVCSEDAQGRLYWCLRGPDTPHH